MNIITIFVLCWSGQHDWLAYIRQDLEEEEKLQNKFTIPPQVALIFLQHISSTPTHHTVTPSLC